MGRLLQPELGLRPLWPFEINRHSKQADGLVYWNPCLPWGNYSPALPQDLPACDWTNVTWDEDGYGIPAPTFNGSTSYGLIADDPIFDKTSSIIVSCWIYTPNVSQANKSFFSKYRSDNNQREWTMQISSSKFRVSLGDPADGTFRSQWQNTGTNLQDNTWHHLALRYTTLPDLWIDGVDVGQSIVTGSSLASNLYNGSARIVIGGVDGATPSPSFSGSVFDARIYHTDDTNVIQQMHDPNTRWDLYAPTIREQLHDFIAEAPAAATFNPAWASGSNTILGSGSVA